MKTMAKFIKKAAKWYFNKMAETYTMTPTGCIPPTGTW